MKKWQRADEWVELAACWDSTTHTGEDLTDEELDESERTCWSCQVRVECIQWALREKACAVMVAGVYLPDPMHKKDLRRAHQKLEEALPQEILRRGDEV